MKNILTACAVAALLAYATQVPAAAPDVPAGDYTLDASHSSLTFRVSHMGFSNYTARFGKFDAKLKFDPVHPATSQLDAMVDANSLELPSPPPSFVDEIRGANWLDAKQYPQMLFHSTRVEVTGANTARITGDFTMHGATHPVVLDATFNGGYKGMSMDPNARVGFSAHGTLKRSEFGVAKGIPAPGTNMGVSDNVEIILETEFKGPALPTASAKQ